MIVRIMTFSIYYAHTDPVSNDLNSLAVDKLVVHSVTAVSVMTSQLSVLL